MRHWRRSQVIQSKDVQTMASAAREQDAAKDIFYFWLILTVAPFSA
jgi:hypothetical protein